MPESYREIQPNKKVPAIDHDGTWSPNGPRSASISPMLSRGRSGAGDRRQGRVRAYPTWLVYCDSVFDPAVAARANGWEYQSNNFSFGLFEDMVANVERLLLRQPYAVGDSFTAADTQLAAGINFTMNILKVLPRQPVFLDYVARATDRPAYRRYVAKDMELAKKVTLPAFSRNG